MAVSKNPLSRWLLGKVFTGLSLFMVLGSLIGCAPIGQATDQAIDQATQPPNGIEAIAPSSPAAAPEASATAVFAGGCFWCMEPPFDALPGVVSTTSGYTGGRVENPTYGQVSAGGTGHYEAMKVVYDPQQVSYDELLETFWVNVDPVDSRGQFCDKGSQYLSAIFYETPEQQAAAAASKDAIAARLQAEGISGAIATEILPAAPFYDAEDYHQNYYQTHPVRYKVYRYGCGRDQRLAEVWGDDAPSHD